MQHWPGVMSAVQLTNQLPINLTLCLLDGSYGLALHVGTPMKEHLAQSIERSLLTVWKVQGTNPGDAI